MKNVIFLLLVISALIIVIGVYYIVFTAHTDIGMSLITVGLASSAVSSYRSIDKKKV